MTAAAALALLLGPGCGGRSALSTRGRVNAALDRGSPGRDRGPGSDLGGREGGLPLDLGLQRDLNRPQDASAKDLKTPGDSCLPIPAKQVQGNYAGTWTGQWSCPNTKPETVSGTLAFQLSPAGSPESFKVQGTMSGTVAPVMSFKGTISGSMGCTALSAALPDIEVSSGGVILKLLGQLTGAFQASTGTPAGFKAGVWAAKEQSGACSAKGTWTAAYKGP